MLARPESVAILRGRVGASRGRCGRGSRPQLGDLPLAVAQAASFMAESGMPVAEYLDLVRTRAGQHTGSGAAGRLPAFAGRSHPADHRPAGR